MRDILGDLEAGMTQDPIAASQKAMKPVLPKRFYKSVEVVEKDGGFAVALDGRVAKTTGRLPLSVPSHAIALMLAREFVAQGERIDPVTMPVLRIVNPALDGVAGMMDAVRADIGKYARSDLLCYRAGEPEGLVARQNAAWNPVLALLEACTGARLALAEGVMHVAQPEAAMAAYDAALQDATRDPLTLAATHVMTSISGSAVLALAVAAGWLSPDAAWAAAHVDEDWTNANWGEDAEAMARRAARHVDFEAAAAISAAMRG